MSLDEIKEYIGITELNLEGCSVPSNTYSRMPYNMGFPADLDHVLWTSEFVLENASSHLGKSDHKLIYCDLKEIENKSLYAV